MNKLTLDEFQDMYKDRENISGKPIYIDFYADW